MYSRLLLTLLFLLPFTPSIPISAQRAQGVDSVHQQSAPTASHLYAPDSIPASSLFRIDSLAQAGIAMGAYPGCQLFALYRDILFLGFDKPHATGDPTGIYAYDHRGFADTCWGIDSTYDLVFIRHSNRTYPLSRINPHT